MQPGGALVRSLKETVVCTRRIVGNASAVQSLAGVALRNGDTWLINPVDKNVSMPVMNGLTGDPWGNLAQIQVFQCHVGSYLDVAFPHEPDVEIFRLHFNGYKLIPEQPRIYGELLAEYQDYAQVPVPWSAHLSLERLWGPYFADRDRLVSKFQTRTWNELLYRCSSPVVDGYKGFLPHPGLAPGDLDEIDEYIAGAQQVNLADRVAPARVM
jgi:hypothetical protein